MPLRPGLTQRLLRIALSEWTLAKQNANPRKKSIDDAGSMKYISVPRETPLLLSQKVILAYSIGLTHVMNNALKKELYFILG